MKNILITIFAVMLPSTAAAAAATSSATNSGPPPVEDRQVARLIGLINSRFPDSAADLKTVTVNVDKHGQLRIVQLIPRLNNAQTNELCRRLRHANLGPADGDYTAKHIKLTFLR